MKRKRVGKWLLGAIAKCSDCEFEEENYTIAQQKGRAHHKKTGHAVIIETTYCQEYKEVKQ